MDVIRFFLNMSFVSDMGIHLLPGRYDHAEGGSIDAFMHPAGILVFVAQAIACDFMCGRRGVAADSEWRQHLTKVSLHQLPR